MKEDSAILVEISIGELFDKISILEIKKVQMSDPAKLRNVTTELETLEKVASTIEQSEEIEGLRRQLRTINEQLWGIEDDIRICEAKDEFGDRFVELARSVYITNDKRANVKRKINELAGSRLVEEKDYSV